MANYGPDKVAGTTPMDQPLRLRLACVVMFARVLSRARKRFMLNDRGSRRGQ